MKLQILLLSHINKYFNKKYEKKELRNLNQII